MSSATTEGLRDLNYALAKLVTEERKAHVPASQKRFSLLTQKTKDSGFVIRLEEIGGQQVFRIIGSKPER